MTGRGGARETLGWPEAALRSSARDAFSPVPSASRAVEATVVEAFRAARANVALAGRPGPGRRPAADAAGGTPAAWVGQPSRLVLVRTVNRPPDAAGHASTRPAHSTWVTARWTRMAAAVVLAMVIGASGGVAATRAGAPLYGVRLAVETALLPTAAAPSRVDRQLQMLEDRMAEVDDATSRHDAAATRAALAAYRDGLRDLAGIVALHPDRRAEVVERLERQAAALRRLAENGEAGSTARAALVDAGGVRWAISRTRPGADRDGQPVRGPTRQ